MVNNLNFIIRPNIQQNKHEKCCTQPAPTWVNLPVGAYAKGIHNTLEARCELGTAMVGGGHHLSGHAVQDGGHRASTALLWGQTQ